MRADLDQADPPTHVGIVMAMAAEAAPLIDRLGLKSVNSPPFAAALPTRLYQGLVNGLWVTIACNGTDPVSGVDAIGTTSAALSTLVLLNTEAQAPIDLILSVGTAGGWSSRGAKIATTYLSWPHVVCHDRRVDLPGFSALGEGPFPVADLRQLAESCGWKHGVVTTGDSLDETDVDAERMLETDARAKEMEAAAVVWTAGLHKVPASAIKVITDLVDGPADTVEEFSANLEAASRRLAEAVGEAVDYWTCQS